ncbi:MAG TPA: methyltransferase domain-containing protein [Anaerolineae bacterium]
MPFASQSFSVVVTSFMLLHLTTAEKQQVFREAQRVLWENGRFGCLTGRHETAAVYPTPDEWQSWLEQSGFAGITIRSYRDVYNLVKAERLGETHAKPI